MVFSKLSASAAALTALAAVPLASASSHMIMGGLKPISYQRLDPIVNKGQVSAHLHGFMGANNLNANSDYASNRNAKCTSVPFQTVDLSSYWAPPVYYQDQNTKEFTLMPSSFNIYYFFDRNGQGEKVQAFPEGLRMLAGNPMRSSYNASNLEDQAVSFVCLDYSGAVSNDPAYAERKDLNFPDINKCKDGIRYQVFFPQCWDGQNLDSADHKSHMAYPATYNGGSCPSSHPVHTVGIFYEQIIPVSQYHYWGQGAYVLSTGDSTGLGYHADFLMGWDRAVLQNAVDNCHDMNGDIHKCQVLAPYINQDAASACTFDAPVLNEADGLNSPIAALPGCNPVRSDMSAPASCPAKPAPNTLAAVQPLTSGWGDVGCIAEATNGRALTGASTKLANMTSNTCIGFCASKGFTYAGLEFGDECYCGNSFSNGATGKPVNWYECNTACAGNPTYEKCGGPQRLSVFKAGAGSTAPAPAPPAASAPTAAPPANTLVAIPTPASSVAAPIVSQTSVAAPVPPVISAPAVSAPAVSAPAVSAPTPAQPSSTPVGQPNNTGSGSGNVQTWESAGCVQDGGLRALTGHSFASPDMTPELCMSTCAGKGFSLAGVEFGQECYCGNALLNGLGQQLDAGRACYMSCAGAQADRAKGVTCGGTWAMNLFKLTGKAKRSKHFGRRHGHHSI